MVRLYCYCIAISLCYSLAAHITDVQPINYYNKSILFLRANKLIKYSEEQTKNQYCLQLDNTTLSPELIEQAHTSLQTIQKSNYIDHYTITATRITITITNDTVICTRSMNKSLLITIQPYKPSKKISITSKRRHNRKPIIALDAGHGGKQPGAVRDNILEKDINAAITKKTAQILIHHGYTVLQTRPYDATTALYKRADKGKKADLFVAIHANAQPYSYLPIHGIETYYAQEPHKQPSGLLHSYTFMHQPEDSTWIRANEIAAKQLQLRSKNLAQTIQNAVLAATTTKQYVPYDRGVKQDYFQVLILSNIPAALVEVGYLSYPSELQLLQDDEHQNKIATGIAQGIMNYCRNNNDRQTSSS